jgi:hypothetical protein
LAPKSIGAYTTVKPLLIWGPNVDFTFPTATHSTLLQPPVELVTYSGSYVHEFEHEAGAVKMLDMGIVVIVSVDSALATDFTFPTATHSTLLQPPVELVT